MLNLRIFIFNLFIYNADVDDCGLSAPTDDDGRCCSIRFLIRNFKTSDGLPIQLGL